MLMRLQIYNEIKVMLVQIKKNFASERNLL